MADKNIIEIEFGTDIKTAIQSVINLAKNTQENFKLVYNKWFELNVTPTTTLQYGLNLFFSKSVSQKNIGMSQVQSKQYGG